MTAHGAWVHSRQVLFNQWFDGLGASRVVRKAHPWHTAVYANFGPEPPGEPSWEFVETLIRWLNGHNRTDVFVGESEAKPQQPQRFLAVSGGNDGRYVIGVEDQTRRGQPSYCYLVKPTGSLGEQALMVMVGELPDYFPPEYVQDLDTALAVTKHYFETGRRAKEFHWRWGRPKRV